MGKLFSISKNQVGVFITLLVLIFLGASYFFIYVPKNEKIVQERRFRCLQNIENNINLKIGSSENLLKNLLDSYSKGKYDLKDFNSTTKRYPRKDFTVQPVVLEKEEKDSKKPRPTTDADLITLEINTNTSTPQFTLFESRLIDDEDAKSITYLKIGVKFKFSQFVKPLPADVFDNYIVFDNSKKVFETVPTDLSKINKDSLLHSKNGLDAPSVHDINVGGTDYKMFSQLVNIGTNNQWIISGLVSAGNYQQEKSQLPLWSVLMLLTTALGLIVSLPWLKLYHMGNKDKLTVTDGISSVLVSMLLMSLLFFVVFKYAYSCYSSVDDIFPDPKDSLACKISRDFNREVDTAYARLKTFDQVYKNIHDDVYNLGKNHPGYRTYKGRVSYDAVLKNAAKNLALTQVFWLDSAGKEINNWTIDSVNTPHSSFSSREYFKRIMTRNIYKSGKSEFYLDQVISRITDVFTSVISKKSENPKIPPGANKIADVEKTENFKRSKNTKVQARHKSSFITGVDDTAAVAGMSFTVQSLNNVVMPDGYQFAIIDGSGEVLYHSSADRNLNENLKKEFADSSELVSCIEAKSDASFHAEYYGRPYNIKVKPLIGLPYFIVIFEGQNYVDARDTEAYVFTISMLICLLIFLVIQIGIAFFASSRRSFFKKQLFDTSWVGPKTNSQRQYNLAILVNLAVIGLLIAFFNLDSFLKYVYILLFSISFVALFLNYIFYNSYKRHKNPKSGYKLNAVFALSGFILIIDVAAAITLQEGNLLSLLFFEILLTVIAIGICFIGRISMLKLLKIIRLRKARAEELAKADPSTKNKGGGLRFVFDYTHSFALMATTKLVITNGIPVAFFFIYSFNYEQNLDTRYRQLSFARSLTQKISGDSILDKFDSIKTGALYTAGIYYDNVFIKDIKRDTGKPLPYNNEELRTTKILSSARLFKNYVELKSDNLDRPTAGDEAFFNKLTHEYDSDTTYYKINNGKYLRLGSQNINYPKVNWVMLLIIIVFTILFYKIILSVVRKLFALNLPVKDGWEDIDEKLLFDGDLNGLLLIVGPPGSDKLRTLLNNIKAKNLKGYNEVPLVLEDTDKQRKNVFVADMIAISAEKEGTDFEWKRHKSEALDKKNALVIINHFEYNIKDIKANSVKLDFLEALMKQETSKIIIISAVHPLTFLDSFNELDDKLMQESELERWQVLLGHFRIMIQPLKGAIQDVAINDERLNGIKATSLGQAIIKETKFSHYLNRMQRVTLDVATTTSNRNVNEVSDALVFKLQITSHYFYTYIWQSLTKEEKFLLYDLAEDGLVNPYDDYNLSMLICKGLIIKRYGTLTLFNKGFRNFILTAIGNAEAKRIKNQVKDNGSWGNLKGPLSLAILAILVFLFASQQEAYSRIITYITALGAGIPAIVKVFSMFSNSTQKTS